MIESVTEKDIARLGHSYRRTRVLRLPRGISPRTAPSSRRGLPVFLRCERPGILVESTFRALPTDRKCTTGLSRTTVTGRAAFQPHHPSASFATITRAVRCRFAHHLAPPSLLGTPRRHVVIPRRGCSLLVWILSSPYVPSHRGIFRSRANARLLNYRSRLAESINGRRGWSRCCHSVSRLSLREREPSVSRTCFFLIAGSKDRAVGIVRFATISLSHSSFLDDGLTE